MATALDRTRIVWKRLASDVLVEKRRFSPSRWIPHFERLRRDIASYADALSNLGSKENPDWPDPRVLIWAWCTLRAAPENQRRHYTTLRENAADGKGLAEITDAVRANG